MKIFKNLIEKYKAWKHEEYLLSVCAKHNNEKKDSFWGCLSCCREADKVRENKKREARIEETKEAIIRAHKELNETKL